MIKPLMFFTPLSGSFWAPIKKKTKLTIFLINDFEIGFSQLHNRNNIVMFCFKQQFNFI